LKFSKTSFSSTGVPVLVSNAASWRGVFASTPLKPERYLVGSGNTNISPRECPVGFHTATGANAGALSRSDDLQRGAKQPFDALPIRSETAVHHRGAQGKLCCSTVGYRYVSKITFSTRRVPELRSRCCPIYAIGPECKNHARVNRMARKVEWFLSAKDGFPAGPDERSSDLRQETGWPGYFAGFRGRVRPAILSRMIHQALRIPVRQHVISPRQGPLMAHPSQIQSGLVNPATNGTAAGEKTREGQPVKYSIVAKAWYKSSAAKCGVGQGRPDSHVNHHPQVPIPVPLVPKHSDLGCFRTTMQNTF